MGCDIHLYVEVKDKKGKWKAADTWEQEEGEDHQSVDYKKAYYNGRNYNLFSILADVRNGRGFAGVKTGEGFNPIASPKGVPEDASREYLDTVKRWDGDGHSHSYFTVAELMAYDWTQETKCQGVLDLFEFYKWNRWGRGAGEAPESYSGGVSGGRIKHISIAEAMIVVQRLDKNMPRSSYDDVAEYLGENYPSHYTTVQWTSPYYKAADCFLGRTMPRLWKLGSPTDVRIVFFFDN